MLGTQSQNTGIPVIPAPKEVIIDGKLDEWDLSGRIRSFSDIQLSDDYSVETAAMWDDGNLYLALQWRDPTPMFNEISPKYDPQDGWRSDALQMRIMTDQMVWLTAWYFSGEGIPSLLLERLKDPNNIRAGSDSDLLVGKNESTELGRGVAMAFKKTDKGYIQEIRIPWDLLFKTKPHLQAGSKIQIGLEFIWGDSTGKGWPISRYADNMQPGKTDRLFFWYRKDAWGDATLLDHGKLSLREYRVAKVADTGAIKNKLALPDTAKKFTVVVEDEQHHRVRNLIADKDPSEFTILQKDHHREIEIPWDGKDDFGNFVQPGRYRMRGLWHEGLDAIYDTTFYNPGMPPWETADGRGSWGSNHMDPKYVASAGENIIVSWNFSEGGSATIGIGSDGLKHWGEIRGADPLAATGDSVYGCLKIEQNKEVEKLFRLSATDGHYRPFSLNGTERTFPLPMTEVLNEEKPSPIVAMAAHGEILVLALQSGGLVFLEGNSAKVQSRVQTGKKISGLAFSDKGTLFAIADGVVGTFSSRDGAFLAISTPGLKTPTAIAMDHGDNLLAFDGGPDQQIKAYSLSGTAVYEAGEKGGRAIRGAFNKQAMRDVTSIAVDQRDQIWAVEHTLYPRRVSVWNTSGSLVRDYIGGTGYAGVGGYFEDDPSIAYVGPTEIKLDREKGTQAVTHILWKSDDSRTDEPKTFDINPLLNNMPRRFRSSAGGVEREFLFKAPGYALAEPSVLFMEGRNKDWQPVAAVGLVGQLSGDVGPKGRKVLKEPSGEFSGLSAWDGFFWNDENGDGRVQRSECVIVPGKSAKEGTLSPSSPPIPLGSAWNTAIDPSSLSFYTTGIFRYHPLRFTKEGAPVYGPASIERVSHMENSQLDPMPVPGEKVVLGLCTSGKARSPNGTAFVGIDEKSGQILWSYPNPYPGVHGSHEAPMPSPGLLIGPLKIMGFARVNNEVGSVFAIRGNLGEDYFFTTDGLNVGALFHDRRYPTKPMPENQADIQSKSVAYLSEGGEPFSGWFGKLKDGSIRMNTSISRFASTVVNVTGLETIHRYQTEFFNVTALDIEKSVSTSSEPSVATKLEPYRIVKTAIPLEPDVSAEAWKSVPSVTIARDGFPDKATAQMAYDASNLYVRFIVTDSSPMANGGKDFRRLFKSGDAVDLQIGPGEPAHRSKPVLNDQRILLSFLNRKPAIVLMRAIDPEAPKAQSESYSSPVGIKRFDKVEELSGSFVHAAATTDGYQITAAIPWKILSIMPQNGMRLKGDLGFISSDSTGQFDIARTYWANKETGLVNDEPQEAWLFPEKWGEFIIE